MVELPARGISVRCQVRGDGPSLLLCAGTAYPLDTWPEAFLQPLAARFRLILFDYRGTGGTPGTAGPYSTELFAGDAAALLRELGAGRAHVLGHSMGGRVAQFMALDAPDHVERLVLVATGAGEGLGGGRQEAGIPLETAARMIESGYRGYLEDNVANLFFPSAVIRERGDLVQEVVGPFWAHRPAVRDYLKHVQARQTHFTADRLEQIECPCLVVIGELDAHPGSTGSHMDQSLFLAERIPGAEMRVVARAAHGLFWQEPDATADAILPWLTDEDATSPLDSAPPA